MQVQEARQKVESVAATGSQVIDTIKNLIHEGNVRRISIKQDGDTIAEFRLTSGVLGAALAPAPGGHRRHRWIGDGLHDRD